MAKHGDARDYPYDPKLKMHEQKDLNRLRCIEDRGLAQYLYTLWLATKRNESRRAS